MDFLLSGIVFAKIQYLYRTNCIFKKDMSALTFDKSELGNLEYSLQREMLSTDRIGGYIRRRSSAATPAAITD